MAPLATTLRVLVTYIFIGAVSRAAAIADVMITLFALDDSTHTQSINCTDNRGPAHPHRVLNYTILYLALHVRLSLCGNPCSAHTTLSALVGGSHNQYSALSRWMLQMDDSWLYSQTYTAGKNRRCSTISEVHQPTRNYVE